MADSTPPAASNPESEVAERSSDSVSSFADDDLGRIQGILLGDHARKTEERLNVMEIALLGAIADLREETATKFEAIDAKLTAESDTRERAVSNIGSRIGRDIAEQSAKVDDLRTEVESVEANATNAIDTVESTIAKGLADAKTDAKREVDSAVSHIKDNNVDRKDLARLLRELGDKFDK